MDFEPVNDSQPIDGELFKLIGNIQSEDAKMRLESMTQIRKLLCSDHSPPIAEVTNTGILPVFLRYLEKYDDPKLQIETVWALIPFTSEQTEAVVDAGVLPPLVALLDPQNVENLQKKAVWALGNIAGDSPFCRDRVLQAGALPPLLRCLVDADIELLRISSSTLSNLCRGKPPPPFHYIQPAIAVVRVLLNFPDDEILTNVCCALSYLTDGTNDRIQAVVYERDIIPRVVELLDHESPSVHTPAVRMIGNIVSGDENQTQTVLQCPRALPLLSKLLSHPNDEIVCQETLWALANVTAGTQHQIQAVIDSGVLNQFDTLIQGGQSKITFEILTVLSNAAAAGGTIKQVHGRGFFFLSALFQGRSLTSLKQLEEIFLENVSLLDFLLESLLKNEEFQTWAMEGLINILLKASHLHFPHPFAIQISQSSFDAIGIVQNLKVQSPLNPLDIYEKQLKKDFLKKQIQLLELLEKALANIGSSVKPAKKESV